MPVLNRLRSGVAAVQTRLGGRWPVSGQSLRLALPIVALAIGVTVLISLWLWRDDASYKPVFGAQEKWWPPT